MTRRKFGAAQFDAGLFAEEEDADPRVGLVNLADVMLVFACGLMAAIVSHWGVNLSAVDAVSTENMQEIDDVQSMVEQMQSGAGNYGELGKVYQDPETGTMYLLQTQTDEGSDGEAADSGENAANG